jgi:hypothetical protein
LLLNEFQSFPEADFLAMLFKLNNYNMMTFRVFKQMGKDVIINLENIVSVKTDETSKKTVIYSTNQINEVDETLEEIKIIFGVGPKREVKGF